MSDDNVEPIKVVIELNIYFYLIQYADNVSRTVGVQYNKKSMCSSYDMYIYFRFWYLHAQ